MGPDFTPWTSQAQNVVTFARLPHEVCIHVLEIRSSDAYVLFGWVGGRGDAKKME